MTGRDPVSGQVVDLVGWLARRRRWDRLGEMRPWRVRRYDAAIVDSRERPGQLKIGRGS